VSRGVRATLETDADRADDVIHVSAGPRSPPGPPPRGRRWRRDSVPVAVGRGQDLRAVLARPFGQGVDGVDQGGSERGQPVLDTRRRFRVRLPHDEALRLEPPERLREHLAGDAADEPDEVTAAHRTAAQRGEHHRGPLLSEEFDRQSRRAVREEDAVGAESSHRAKGTRWCSSET
jgi:hypothetical protein